MPGASVASVVGQRSQSPTALGSPPEWMAGGWAHLCCLSSELSSDTHSKPTGLLARTRHLCGSAKQVTPKTFLRIDLLMA